MPTTAPEGPLSIRILARLGVVRFSDAKYEHVFAAMLAVSGSILLAIGTILYTNVLIVRLDLVGYLVELSVLAITLAALHRSKAAPNDAFNYGMGKLENLCGLLFTLVQVVYLVIFVWLALGRLHDPTILEGAAFGAALYAYSAATAGFMIRGMRFVRKSNPSPVIDALYRGYVIKLWTSVGTAAVLAATAAVHDATIGQYLEPLNVIVICSL
ncbi:MAG: cation transporter, partial [Alphaproteobacteria bacterium]